MPRPDPALLDPARYPYNCRIEPRFGDLDLNRHLNNVAIASLLEEAHVRFHRVSGYAGELDAMTYMVASVATEYLGQGSYPEPIDIHLAVESIGRTSHVLVKLAMQSGRAIAFSRTVLVTVGAAGPAAIPPRFLERVDEWSLRP
jgi:acyl-CoA thioester hydrolase